MKRTGKIEVAILAHDNDSSLCNDLCRFLILEEETFFKCLVYEKRLKEAESARKAEYGFCRCKKCIEEFGK